MSTEITDAELRRRIHANPKPTGDRERQCDYCDARVTASPDGSAEYGHWPECPDRPDSFPVLGSRKDGEIRGGEKA